MQVAHTQCRLNVIKVFLKWFESEVECVEVVLKVSYVVLRSLKQVDVEECLGFMHKVFHLCALFKLVLVFVGV